MSRKYQYFGVGVGCDNYFASFFSSRLHLPKLKLKIANKKISFIKSLKNGIIAHSFSRIILFCIYKETTCLSFSGLCFMYFISWPCYYDSFMFCNTSKMILDLYFQLKNMAKSKRLCNFREEIARIV